MSSKKIFSTKAVSIPDKEEHIETLRKELLFLLEKKLSPLALKYKYASVPLESKVKWKPVVLVLGNYSSGKSTLINEFVGTNVQHTGQAPTDDAFTVLTCDESGHKHAGAQEGEVYEERDGNVLLNDTQYPFELLKKHGEKFASHFRVKKVKSRVLKNLAIIDTPGMLDSASDNDRGYDYQGVIGDLALIADLVLVLFDPHKAGTIRESHFSLRDTLPEKTFEDRVVFVLNRIDECSNLEDLLRVYGSLCWNLAFMTGRKDIPPIRLCYASSASQMSEERERHGFLRMLENQRTDVTKAILSAPKHRLDHLASFVEYHCKRMSQFTESLLEYASKVRLFQFKLNFLAFVGSLLSGGAVGAYMYLTKSAGWDENSIALLSGGVFACTYFIWRVLFLRIFMNIKHSRLLKMFEERETCEDQNQTDTWQRIKPFVISYLRQNGAKLSISNLKKEMDVSKSTMEKGVREIRRAINEI